MKSKIVLALTLFIFCSACQWNLDQIEPECLEIRKIEPTNGFVGSEINLVGGPFYLDQATDYIVTINGEVIPSNLIKRISLDTLKMIVPEGIESGIVEIKSVNNYQVICNANAGNNLIFNYLEPKECGLYSESTPVCFVFGNDSDIGFVKSSRNSSLSLFRDDTNCKAEGPISKKTTWAVTEDGWAVWFIQFGKLGTPDLVNTDMSDFEDGKLTFWVKTSINLEIGMRSNGIDPGDGEPVIYLQPYLEEAGVPFDSIKDKWVKICVPIKTFQQLQPKLNLEEMKILFFVASNQRSGGTPNGTSQTFWIDDVRWELKGEYKDCIICEK